MALLPSAFRMSIYLLLLCVAVFRVNAVHGRHYMRRMTQQRQMEVDADTELEEEMDSETEEEALLDRIISLSSISTSSPIMAASSSREHSSSSPAAQSLLQPVAQQQSQHHQQQQQQFGKDNFFEQGETRDFLHFLRRIKYDHRQCPQNGGQSVLISVSVVVSNIRAVSEVTMDYSLEMFYRESWLDDRLRYDVRQFRNKTELALHESYANFLWHPDTFMPNAIASKNPRKQSISHRSLLRLQSDGQILYSRRLSVVAECPMDLTLFPFDSQTCKLGIESYGYTSDQVRYGWSQGQRMALKLHKIRLPDFRIKEAFVTTQMESYATGNYSRLYVCFVFSRSAGFCFLQLIIPSTAVVITSWVSLWMENETSFQDMISIILTITFLLFSYNEVMPRVSYLKALDIWLAVCFMIVFLSLIKLAIMKYMRQRLKVDTDGAGGCYSSTQEHSLLAGMLPIMQLSSATARQMGNGLLPGGKGVHGHAGTRSKRASTTSGGLGTGIGAANVRPPTPPPHLGMPNALNVLHQHRHLLKSPLDHQLSHQSCSSQQRRHGVTGDPQPLSQQHQQHHRRQRSPSAGGSSAAEEMVTMEQREEEECRRRRRSTITSGLESILGSTISQLLAHQAITATAASGSGSGGGSRRKASAGSMGGSSAGGHHPQQHQQMLAPYQPPISTLAATALNLPLSQSSLRQLQQHKLYQVQQQLQFQMQLQQSQLLHQAQLEALKAERRRERQRRREKEERRRLQQAQAAVVGRRRIAVVDRNQNELAAPPPRRSPISSIRIGIEESSRSSDDNNSSAADDSEAGTGHGTGASEKKLFFCFDQFGNVEFSAQFIRRFHWISQMSFFFGFVLFCLYFFLIYPNNRSTTEDPACRREEAEWFASIPL